MDFTLSNLSEMYKMNNKERRKEKSTSHRSRMGDHSIFRHVSKKHNDKPILTNPVKGELSRIKNTGKTMRMFGQDYVKTIKKSDGSYVVVSKAAKKVGPPCTSLKCKKSTNTRFCHLFDLKDRTELFNEFWQITDWNLKKQYILSLVEPGEPARRKGFGLKVRVKVDYFLKKDGKRYQVCQNMFLTTFDLKDTTLHRWVQPKTKNVTLAMPNVVDGFYQEQQANEEMKDGDDTGDSSMQESESKDGTSDANRSFDEEASCSYSASEVVDMCRACSKESLPQDLHYIFSTPPEGGPEYYYLINSLLGLDVQFGDGLPSSVCTTCVGKLKEWQAFKEECHAAQAVMKSCNMSEPEAQWEKADHISDDEKAALRCKNQRTEDMDQSAEERTDDEPWDVPIPSDLCVTSLKVLSPKLLQNVKPKKPKKQTRKSSMPPLIPAPLIPMPSLSLPIVPLPLAPVRAIANPFVQQDSITISKLYEAHTEYLRTKVMAPNIPDDESSTDEVQKKPPD